MSKLSTLDNPLERISGTDPEKENPYKIKLSQHHTTPDDQGLNDNAMRDYSPDNNNPYVR